MPRPPFKRRKPNQSPIRRVAKFDSTAAKVELERKLANKPVGRRPQDSDDSDGLVTKTRAARNTRTPQREIYASGAIGKGDQPGAWPSREQRTRSMRQDTAEILRQRSASLSRGSSVISGRSIEATPALPQDIEKPAAVVSARSTKHQRIDALQPTKEVAGTPSGETSILGHIRPRKRQPSILQLVNNDESAINSGDEEEFLPDEVSTPVNIDPSRTANAPSASESRKRKRGSDLTEIKTQISGRKEIEDSSATMNQALTLPAPSRTQSKLLSRQKAIEEEIMALPQSSPEPSPPKAVSPIVKRKLRPTQINLSTQQLKSFMPSKRYTSMHPRRNVGNDFDIPEDSSSDPPHQVTPEPEKEHSVFLPSKSKKSKAQKGTTNVKSKKQVVSEDKKKRQKDATAESVLKPNQNKSTKTSTSNDIHTPSPKRLRKPLPLSSAKSRVQLQDKTNTANIPTSAKITRLSEGKEKQTEALGPKSDKQQHGGSQGRSGRVTRARASGKENDPSSTSSAMESIEIPDIVETIELNSVTPTTSPQKYLATTFNPPQQQASADALAWQKTWGDIDDYSLDFEEVTPASLDDSTRSSQRDMR